MNMRFREKVVPWIEQYLLVQQQNALYKSLYKLCEPFNEFYSVQVQEIAPIDSGDPCKYQEHTIRFGNESGFALIDIHDTWTLHAPQDDDQLAVKSEFTYLSYLLAGAQDRIMLFPKGSDATNPEDAVLTKTFDWDPNDPYKLCVIDLVEVGLSWDFDFYGVSIPGPKGYPVYERKTLTIDDLAGEPEHTVARIINMSYDDYIAYCKTIVSLPGWEYHEDFEDETLDNLPDEASIGYKPVYVTGKLPGLPLVTIVYVPESRLTEDEPWNFSFTVYPVWEGLE
jgi:hypothetical protein